LVWHSTRHEFISRTAEQTKDPLLTQQRARHRDMETTGGYFHARDEAIWNAAAALNRRRA
jgi:hypothetical protein